MNLKKATVFFASIVMLLSFSSCNKVETKEYSGEEWLQEQTETKDDIESIVKSTEDVYSLYISGNMTGADFMNELKIIQAQLYYYQNDYEKRKGNITLKPNMSSNSKSGIESLENLFIDIDKLYQSSINKVGVAYSPIEASYVYIAYKDKIINDYAGYASAIAEISKEE